jgi:hypothetical protein
MFAVFAANRWVTCFRHLFESVFSGQQNRYIQQKGRDRRLLRRVPEFTERQSQIPGNLSRQSDSVACYVKDRSCSEGIPDVGCSKSLPGGWLVLSKLAIESLVSTMGSVKTRRQQNVTESAIRSPCSL